MKTEAGRSEVSTPSALLDELGLRGLGHPEWVGRSHWTSPGKGKYGNTFSSVLWGCLLLFSFLLVFFPDIFSQVLDPVVLKEDSGSQNLQGRGESEFISRQKPNLGILAAAGHTLVLCNTQAENEPWV